VENPEFIGSVYHLTEKLYSGKNDYCHKRRENAKL
jgi:hypothetical protein